MDLRTRHEICSPGVICEDFDGQIVILNLDDGCYYSLEGACPQLWQAVVDGAAPQSIIDEARSACEALADPTHQFLLRLHELQLIRPANIDPATGDTAIDWASISVEDLPQIEVFDDLAELILADPIHDVDADAGWPIRKAA